MGLSLADAVAYATKPTLENGPPRLAQVNPPPTRPEQPAAEEAAGERQRPTLRVLVASSLSGDAWTRCIDRVAW
jgi:hypothetical protein